MPALAAYFLKRAAGFRYSLAAHAWDIYADTTMLKAKIEAAEFVVTCTRANREHLEAISGNATPIVVSYHGLDFERVSSPRFDRAGELSILAVGRLVEQKGFRHLVEACALLATKGRTFRCRIIGDGPLRSSLQREIQDRGLNDVVTLSGPSPLPEVFDAYRKATLLCVPSVVASDGDRDGIPNVIIEAMSQGLPVVASRVSGIPEVVREGETGWLLPPGDAAALAEACDAVAKGAPEAARRAAAAHAFVRREFDVTTNTAPLLDLFRKTGSAQERIARLS
jgi:glycosyltransferase involved in cell wall biosynthesis